MNKRAPYRIYTIPKVKPRLRNVEDWGDLIIRYGADNLYPNEMLQKMRYSGTCSNAVDKRYKFVKGDGFEDQTFARARLNYKGRTANQLLAEVAYQLSIFNGFALHFNFNLLGEWTEVHIVPFEFCRKGDQAMGDKIAVFPDWDGAYYKPLSKSDIQYYDKFDPSKVVEQIEECGGIQNYKGQILYYVDSMDIYPLASFDAVLEDVESDYRIKNFGKNTIKNGFSATTIIEYPSAIEDGQEGDVADMFTVNMGDDEAGNTMIIANPAAATNPLKVHKVEYSQSEAMFTSIKSSVREAIYTHFDIPSVLRGDAERGLFNQEQMRDSYTYFNEVTKDYRQSITEVFEGFMQFYAFGEFANFNIKAKSFGTDSTTVSQ